MSILHQIPCNYVYNANLGKLVFIVNMSLMNVNSYKCKVIKKLNQIIKKNQFLKVFSDYEIGIELSQAWISILLLFC